MSYSSKADIQKEISDAELIGLTDDAGTGSMDDAKITAAIAKGDAIADPFYGKVTDVPIPTPIPGIVKENSITMGIYFLYSRRSAVPEIRAKNFDDVMKLLGKISKGEVALFPTTTDDYEDSVQVDRAASDRKITMGKDSDGSSGTLDNY